MDALTRDRILRLAGVELRADAPEPGQRYRHGWIPIGAGADWMKSGAGAIKKIHDGLATAFGSVHANGVDWKGAHFTVDVGERKVPVSVTPVDVASLALLAVPGGNVAEAAKVALIVQRIRRALKVAKAAETVAHAVTRDDDVEYEERKFHPDQLRDPGGEGGGQWVKAPGLKDALKLAGKIELEPGETLVGSSKIADDYGTIRLAVTDKGGNRSVRIGVGDAAFGGRDDEAGSWTGSPDRIAEINAGRKKLRDEAAALEAEEAELLDRKGGMSAPWDSEGADRAEWDRLHARLAEIEKRYGVLDDTETNDVDPSGHTAKLDAAGIERLRSDLPAAVAKAEAVKADDDARYAEVGHLEAEYNRVGEAREPYRLRYVANADDAGSQIAKDRAGAAGPPLSPEEDAEFDRLQAQWDSLYEQWQAAKTAYEADFSNYDRSLTEGSVPGEWGDLHYRVYYEEEDVQVRLTVVPRGMTFEDVDESDLSPTLDPSQVRKLLDQIGGAPPRSADVTAEAALRHRVLSLAGISGLASTETRGHPHPGQRFKHGWVPVSPLALLSPDVVDDEYGRELDSAEFGDTGRIVAREHGVTVESDSGSDLAIHATPSADDAERWATAIRERESFSRSSFATEPHDGGMSVRFGDHQVDLDDSDADEVAQALLDMAYVTEDHQNVPDDEVDEDLDVDEMLTDIDDDPRALRHRSLALAGVAGLASVPQPDLETRALLVAIRAHMAGETRDWKKQVRDPGGEDGGQWVKGAASGFKSLLDRAKDALAAWSKGDGPDNPLADYNRDQLRKVAVGLKLTVRRGAPAEEISGQILDHIRAGGAPDKPDDAHRRFTIQHGGKPTDVGISTYQGSGHLFVHRESDAGRRGARVSPEFANLGELESWARDNGHTELADYVRDRQGKAVPGKPVKVAKSAPKKAANPLEDAARTRQAKADTARGVAETLTELDELSSNGASPKAMETRLRAQGKLSKVDPATVDTLVQAGVSGDRVQVDAAIDRIAAQHGLHRTTGPAGSSATFDRTKHQPIGKAIGDGVAVDIVRPGYEADLDGERVLVHRAVVQTAAPKADPGVLSDDPDVRAAQIDDRIRATYQALLDLRAPSAGYGDRPANRVVSLADLREGVPLPGWRLDNGEIDNALKRLITQPGVILIPESNQSALTPRLREGAARIGGQDKHHISIADPSPRPLPGTPTPLPAVPGTPDGGEAKPATESPTDLATRLRSLPPTQAGIDEATAALEGKSLRELQDIRNAVGGTASRQGKTKPELVRDIVEGTVGFRARSEAMLPGGWRPESSSPSPAVKKVAAGRAPKAPRGRVTKASRQAALEDLHAAGGQSSHANANPATLDALEADGLIRREAHVVHLTAAGRDELAKLRTPSPSPTKRAPRAPKVTELKAPAKPKSQMSRMTAEQRKIARELGLPDGHPLARIAEHLGGPGDRALLEGLHPDDLAQVGREIGATFPARMKPEDRLDHILKSLGSYGITPGESVHTAPSPSSAAVAKVAAARKAPTVDLLTAMGSREEARVALEGLTMAQLRIINPSAGRMAKDRAELIDLIVEATVGLRLDSAAIRGTATLPYRSSSHPLREAVLMDAEARGRTLALLGVTRAAGHDVTPGHDELHHYWTRGKGLAKWANSPKPWTTLVALLTEHVGPERAKVFASRWFIEVKGYAAGSDKNRVAHGHPPRGHLVGPG